MQFKVRQKCSSRMGIKNALLVCALGGDDVASRVGHVAEEGVEEIIYNWGGGVRGRRSLEF